MTVSNNPVKVTVLANGAQTVFDYSFLIPAKTQAELLLTDASGNQTTIPASAWSLTGAGDSEGGTFTYPLTGAALTAPSSLTLIRVSPPQQTTKLGNQGPFYQQTVERALDYQTLISQQLAENLSRAFQFPAGESLSGIVPGVLERAGYVLGFSSQVGHEGELTLFASAGGEQGPPGTGLPSGGESGQLLYNNGPGSAAWFETAGGMFRLTEAALNPPWGTSAVPYLGVIGDGSQPPWRTNAVIADWYMTEIPSTWPGGASSLILDLSSITEPLPYGTLVIEGTNGSGGTLEIKFPPTAMLFNGQHLRVMSLRDFTALTCTPNSGQTIAAAPTRLDYGTEIDFKWVADAATWIASNNGVAPSTSVGTVNSVALSVPPGGVFSVTGSPITSAGTLAVSSNGTIGGIPYFNGAGSIATTGAMTRYGPVIGGGTVSAPHSVAVGSAGQAFLSAGGTADPGFGAIDLAGGTTVVSGILPTARGGTGLASFTANGIVYASGTSTLGQIGVGTSGQALISAGASAPAFGPINLAGGTNVVSGILPTTNGGLGIAPPFTFGSLVYATSTAALGQIPTVGVTNSVLHGGTAPGWAAVNLNSSGDCAGILSLFNGGLGFSSTAAGDMFYGTGGPASALAKLTAGTSSQVLIGGTTPSWGALPLGAMTTIAAGTVLGNNGTASAVPSALTPSQAIDIISGASARGSLLYRGSGGWAALAPSATVGAVLSSGGTGADPSYLVASQTVAVRIETSGVTLATGYKAVIRWPRDGVITEWAVTAENAGAPQSDTCSLDITNDMTFGTNTSMVGAGTKPNLSAASSGSAAPSGWTSTSFTAGRYARVNLVTAPGTATAVTLFLKWRPTA